MHSRLTPPAALVTVWVLASAQPAYGQENKYLDFEGDVAVISDYIFRGISRSGGDFAVQGSLTANHHSGFYLGTLASLIDDPFGHDFEVEGFVGYYRSIGEYDLDLSVSLDSFHGSGDSESYLDFRANVSRDFGLIFVRTGIAVSPDNREYGNGGSVYGFGELSIPLTFDRIPPMSLDFAIGYEDFENSFDKWDWSVGLFTSIKTIEVGVKYTDTDLKAVPGAGSRFVFSIRKYF